MKKEKPIKRTTLGKKYFLTTLLALILIFTQTTSLTTYAANKKDLHTTPKIENKQTAYLKERDTYEENEGVDIETDIDNSYDEDENLIEDSEDIASSDVVTMRIIDESLPMVAITFDDGPHKEYTEKILDILTENNAVATFFEVGELVEKYPEIVKKESDQGSDVESHGYSHKDLTTLSKKKALDEISKADKAIEDATGYKPSLIRPAYGAYNKKVLGYLDKPAIFWSIDTRDWKLRNAKKIYNEIKNAGNLDGDVILLHSIHKETVEALKLILPYLSEKGYQFVTVKELVKYKGYKELEKGKVYGCTFFGK